MEIKGHGTIKKSKAYGAIGTLLLSGVLLFAAGGGTVKADETVCHSDTAESVLATASVPADNSSTALSDAVIADSAENMETRSNAIESGPAADISENVSSESVDTGAAENLDDPISSVSDSQPSLPSEEAVYDESRESLDKEDAEPTDSGQGETAEEPALATETREKAATGAAASEITSIAIGDRGFDLQYNQAIAAGTEILFAVWSNVNGQDDLIWYTADKNGRATAKYTGTYGNYHIHTYQNANGRMIGLNAATVNLLQPNVSVAVTKVSKTAYKIRVTDAPAYITAILLPTWTSANGQDDLIWYKAAKAADGTYSATVSTAEHYLESGEYNVHVYGESAVTNSLSALTGTSFKNDYVYGDIAVSASLGQNGIDITMPSDVSKALTVYHAVWSAQNGQDDMVWYKVDSSGQTRAAYTGDYGTYHIHTYGLINGRMVGLNAINVDVARPNVSVQLDKVNETSVRVTVRDVPAYFTNITLPTWTSKNGQDDLKWYQAVKTGDGTYSLTFYAKDHKFESGHYNVHVYGQSQVTKSFVGLTATNGIDLSFSGELANPAVTVQNYDAAKGTLQVLVTETENSKSIASLAVAAWSQAGQQNIYWYTAEVINGRAVVTVDEKYHHNISGDYTVHAYVKTKDGETIGYDLRTYTLANKEASANVSTSYQGTGVYAVSISGVYSNGAVKYAVWSDASGQDDLVWYDAAVSGTNAGGVINVANHSGTGTYHLHVYQSDNGQMYFLTSTDFTVSRSTYTTPYYNQRDGRWGNTRYGYYTMASTGCVPTALAMVFTSLTGTEVLPTTVADYLYNQTVEFNRGGEGTTGRGILMASNQWGMTATVLSSSSALSAALQEGHQVVGAVQLNKFSPWGWGTSHELVLKGYSNGNTYVFDPYNAANNGWYPIASLWNEQSTQAGDINGLGRPFVKITDI
ncbi:GBS Bsp-like repeat-containing protein [Streptococcus pantholopis]|uniref:Cell surface protein n=1 Tax=Streptococcus pantholopis TaxID=1811193 RepID=A0A172Q898_9STRE|nr:GBS Bsp-like repeat-containing protein [Streptococcus pantholopis]AND79709.1 cell surface protein [Streptococcus pantholopis]